MPNIHPLLVHFPIALLPMALFLDMLSLILKRPGLSESAWIVQIVGTILLVVTVVSGLSAEGSGMVLAGARHQFELHEQLAFLTAAVFLLLFLWRIGGRGRLPTKATATYLVLTAIGVGLTVFTAWAGADLVYVFGTGVGLR